MSDHTGGYGERYNRLSYADDYVGVIRDPIADGGRDHHLAPGHRLVDEEIGEAVIVLDVSRNGAVRLSVDGDGYDRRRLGSEEIVEWFDSGRLRFEDPEEDAVLNPANATDGGNR